MIRETLSAVLFLLSIAVGRAALGSATSSNLSGNGERDTDDRGVLQAIAQAPVKTRQWHNPYEDQPAAVLAGKKLFLSTALNAMV